MKALASPQNIQLSFYDHFERDGVTFYRFKVSGLFQKDTFAVERFSYLLELRNRIKNTLNPELFKSLPSFPPKLSLEFTG